jgi:hypothetical protein
LLLSVSLLAACTGSGLPGSGGASPTPAAETARPALPAGQYSSTTFRPPVSFTLPDGWQITGDTIDYFALGPVASAATGIHVFRSPRAASQAADCPLTAEPGVGTTAKDLVDWIRARPGFVAGDPVAVTMGGLAGLQVDLAIVEGWTPSCPFAGGLPTVALFVATDPSFRWVVAGNERLRLRILDVPGDGTIVVDIDAFDGSLMDGFLPGAATIVESMRFALS